MNYRTDDTDDSRLVTLAKKGQKKALETLIKKYQDWIYNLALRMVGNPDDAQDITQEVLIKLITKLSTFRNQSSFKTWLYRITVNHFMNMKKYTWERMFSRFEKHDRFKQHLDQMEISNTPSHYPDEQLIVEETRSLCMTGMLLCLDRDQRLVFILGSVLGIESKMGGEILEMRPDNYRQILSRARKQLSNFMNEKCGLLNENNPCRCAGKTRALIKAGWIDPDHLRFNKRAALQVKEFITEKKHFIDNALENKMQYLFQHEPMLHSPDLVNLINTMLKRKPISDIINFN